MQWLQINGGRGGGSVLILKANDMMTIEGNDD